MSESAGRGLLVILTVAVMLVAAVVVGAVLNIRYGGGGQAAATTEQAQFDAVGDGPGEVSGGITEGTVSDSGAVVPQNEAAEQAEVVAPAFSYHAFQSPTGNIVCQVGGTLAGHFGGDINPRAACLQTAFKGQAPKPDCSAFGNISAVKSAAAIDSRGRAVQGVCAGGQPLDYRGDASGLPVLAYGQGTTNGSVTCASSSDGVTCEDLQTGESFTISSRAIVLSSR